jgi:hypothetical protein
MPGIVEEFTKTSVYYLNDEEPEYLYRDFNYESTVMFGAQTRETSILQAFYKHCLFFSAVELF